MADIVYTTVYTNGRTYSFGKNTKCSAKAKKRRKGINYKLASNLYIKLNNV